jgi:putative pre-16S rRNA nuclease
VRVLGIDHGRSRTGLALSDPLEVTCRPFAIVTERDQEKLVSTLLATAKEQDVGRMVVGLPRPLAGGVNKQMASVLAFVQRLERESDIPVLTWDERFTTKLAERGRSRTEPHDSVAACYMLQSYLDAFAG